MLLFAVSVVQLSHTHSSIVASSGKNKKAAKFIESSSCDTSSLSSSCFICDYQLAKDTDASHAEFKINKPVEFNIAAIVTYSFVLQGISTVFETRGPPSI